MIRINHILGKVLFFDALGGSAFWPDCVNQGDCQYNQSIVDIIRALAEFMQADKKNRH
jgi:hypothetical protein